MKHKYVIWLTKCSFHQNYSISINQTDKKRGLSFPSLGGCQENIKGWHCGTKITVFPKSSILDFDVIVIQGESTIVVMVHNLAMI
jgi:hypothetical protein